MNRHEAADVYGALEEEVTAAAADLAALATEAAQLARAAQAEQREVAGALAAVYLPRLDAEALARAARWTGYQGFTRRDPIRAMAHEEARLKAELAKVLGDVRYVEREARVGPAGSLTRSLAEAKDFLAPWQLECERFEHLEGFLELLEVRYDTPEFEERWWQAGYWRHWAAGDRICDALGLGDFGDEVLPAWERVRAPRDQWKAEVERLQGEVVAIHELVRRHDQLRDRLTHLGEIYLDECHQQLGEHLVVADPSMLEIWAGGEPPLGEAERRAVVVALKRLAGLTAKLDSYRQVGEGWARAEAARLETQAAAFTAKRARLLRNPRKLNLATDDPPFHVRDKLARVRVRREKAGHTLRRVHAFDRYERFSLADDPALWWLLFSDHRAPPVWMPEYRDWYGRHPDVSMQPPEPDPVDPLVGHHQHAAAGDVS